MPLPNDNGIVTLPAKHSVDETVTRLEKIFHEKGITLFALIDHSGEAAKVSLTMLPTKLLIFGSPRAGTPLMLASPSIALDLPLKILVWQDGDGRNWITYNDPAFLARRHALANELAGALAAVQVLAAAANDAS